MKIQSSFIYGVILSFVGVNVPVNAQKTNTDVLALAEKNIQEYRKGNATITLKDLNGEPLDDVSIEVEMVNHDFLFGCSMFDVTGHENWGVFNEDQYLQRIKDVFNLAVFPTHWTTLEYKEGKPIYSKIRRIAEWCKANDIATKGHALVWTHWAGEPLWLDKYSIEESTQYYMNA